MDGYEIVKSVMESINILKQNLFHGPYRVVCPPWLHRDLEQPYLPFTYTVRKRISEIHEVEEIEMRIVSEIVVECITHGS